MRALLRWSLSHSSSQVKALLEEGLGPQARVKVDLTYSCPTRKSYVVIVMLKQGDFIMICANYTAAATLKALAALAVANCLMEAGEEAGEEVGRQRGEEGGEEEGRQRGEEEEDVLRRRQVEEGGRQLGLPPILLLEVRQFFRS